MKNSPYSPDAFMTGLYEKMRAEPYRGVKNAAEALEAGKTIREKAGILFDADKLTVGELRAEKVGKALEYPDYILQKYSVEICDGLKTAVFILTPKNITASSSVSPKILPTGTNFLYKECNVISPFLSVLQVSSFFKSSFTSNFP